eukprot:g29017.t1
MKLDESSGTRTDKGRNSPINAAEFSLLTSGDTAITISGYVLYPSRTGAAKVAAQRYWEGVALGILNIDLDPKKSHDSRTSLQEFLKGSGPGSTIFSCFINDPSSIIKSEVGMFADDC